MNVKTEWKWLAILAAIAILVFSNTVGGEFIYDDTRQILRNPLIQDLSLFWKAVTSDVWAFKGDGSIAASSYWRPTFTIWNIICFQLFGASPAGWHIANLLLHAGVTVLAFMLMRRWSLSPMLAFAIAVVFAVHPVHVESVAWVAGSPDLLFGVFFLGSLWFATNYSEKLSIVSLVLMCVFYVAALGAKEISLLCLPVYYFVLNRDGEEKSSFPWMPMAALAVVAVGYFAIRFSIIGAISWPPPDAVSTADAVRSVPMLFAFYLRQIFAPIWLGINYPLLPVSSIGFSNFILPFIISIAVIVGLFWAFVKDRSIRIAIALFILPLALAMNSTTFISEQLVHDRYLYLPLFGALTIVVLLVNKFVSERTMFFAAMIVAAVLSVQTLNYNRAYADELSLWTWTAAIDDSAFTSMQLGSALAEKGKFEESIASYTRALEKRPSMRGYYGRARGYLAADKPEPALADLNQALALPPDDQDQYTVYQVYEALAIVHLGTKNNAAAIASLQTGRSQLPMYHAALTDKLAIALYQSGAKDEALRELEAARERAKTELLPESSHVLFRLGSLYSELGRRPEAEAVLREFLAITNNRTDKNTLALRGSAQKLIQSPPKPKASMPASGPVR
ncbi:MAG TPA: tetratricopeptide repeat protein [Pyrinomonadaceae bacterium]|nr:tetratricopeptide repeat protein [Pyrinomonadaceae bacterium]